MSRNRIHPRCGFWMPVYSHLLQQLGERAVMLSLVIWHSRGKNGYCNVRVERLAEQLGISRNKAYRQLRGLVAEGWLEDRTPRTRRHTHHYLPTSKCWLTAKVARQQAVRMILEPAEEEVG